LGILLRVGSQFLYPTRNYCKNNVLFSRLPFTIDKKIMNPNKRLRLAREKPKDYQELLEEVENLLNSELL